jgi:16S rRNA A1518/A1519 N6-dimethyltransferase RsmA/KsgA/DIM1 with predicted DNA glycosylase/AP lyase activity
VCGPVAGIGEHAYEHRVLESLASAQNYVASLASLSRPYLGDDPIEIGAGAGDYAAAWLAEGLGRITLTEADPYLLGELLSRFERDDRVAVRELDVTTSPEAEHSAPSSPSTSSSTSRTTSARSARLGTSLARVAQS